jgi:fatty acid-binding protein DegV
LRLTDCIAVSHLKETAFTKSLALMISLVLDEYPSNRDGFLTIMHTGNYELASDLAYYFQENFHIYDPQINDLPSAIITHTIPGPIAAGFIS